jgi:rhamnogalacturonan endolyase
VLDAEKRASLSSYSAFYDSIAHLIPNFIPPSSRGIVSLSITLPKAAKDAVAILSAEDYDFAQNVLDESAYQYWGDVDESGNVRISEVRPGRYRLTMYAKGEKTICPAQENDVAHRHDIGVFGSYVKKGVVISERKTTTLHNLHWAEERFGGCFIVLAPATTPTPFVRSSLRIGTELWRLGTPDRSSGELQHGYARESNKTYHPEQYRVYWGAYNFTREFPKGVRFEIGKSDPATDWVRFSTGTLRLRRDREARAD